MQVPCWSCTVFDAPTADPCVLHRLTQPWNHVTVRDLKRTRQSETFQLKSRKRINDKWHGEKMERLIGVQGSRRPRDSRGQEDKQYRWRVNGKESDTEADVRMTGGWSACCTRKLIKQGRNWWAKKDSDGENRQGQKQLDESVRIAALRPEEDQSVTTGKTDVRKNPPGDPFVA